MNRNRHSRSRPHRGRRHSPSFFQGRYLWGGLAIVALVTVAGLMLFARKNDSTTTGTRAIPNFTPQVEGAPRVEVAEDTQDYGDVKLGTTVNSVFKVRNVGDEPLRIIGQPQVWVVEGC
jgi:hypothetical protein